MDYIDILIFLLILLIIFLLMMINKKYKSNNLIKNNNIQINHELPINSNIVNSHIVNSHSSSEEHRNVPLPFHDEDSYNAPVDSSVNENFSHNVDEIPFIYNKKINNQVENIENDIIYAEY